MSDPILPLAVWEENTLQNDVPANDNSLRIEAMSRTVLAVANSPSVSTDGTVYIVGAAPTGAFSTFDENDLTIYYGGTWYAWAPVSGVVVNVAGVQYQFNGTAWIPVGSTAADPETVSSVSSSSGVVTLNLALGRYFTLTLTENVTSWVISNPPGSGKGFTVMVRITQGAGPYTVAKPGTTAGGVALDVSIGNGNIDVLAITSFDNGSTLRSSIAKNFS